MRSRLLALALCAGALIVLGGSSVAAGAPTELFFSEYVEGTSNNKALEIYNGTGSPVNLAAGAYSVQMFFNGNTAAGLTINLTGTVADREVFVLAQSAANAAILAQADQTNGSGWLNGDDAVVLRKGTTVLDVIGQIGFDPGTEWGAGVTSTADNTLRRKPSIETGDADGTNVFDPATEWDGFATDTFGGLGSHTTGSDAAPQIASSTPTNNGVDVATDSDVEIVFSEAVATTAAAFALSCTTTGAHSFAFSGSGTTYTLDPDADFVRDESCTVTVDGSGVSDVDTDDPPDNMAANGTITFSTLGVPATIMQIQGAGHRSPLVGQSVTDVEGIVTARRIAGGRGFWIQDPSPDTDPSTSDGVFVFTSTTPTVAVGDAVSVSGRVSEFRQGGRPNDLSVTQIVSPTVALVSPGNPVPAPVVVGIGGRMPPTEVIDNDTNGSVETGPTTFDPAEDGIDFYESLEGMLVQVDNGAVVNETESFGEITLLPDNGSWATGTRTPRGGILAAPGYGDFNPERIAIDDEILRDLIVPRPPRAMPIMDVGARILGAIVGPLDYTFSNYKIQALSPPAFVASVIQPETTQAPADQELAAATFNVENLDPGDGPLFDRLAGQIVNNLKAPDLIGIEEVQDNSGSANNGVVNASETWRLLIEAITRAGGPLYEHRQIDPVNNQDGGAPGSNIRVGFLFRTDRGLSFIDRPGGDSTTPTAVVSTPSGPQLSLSPGRIDPANDAFFETRKSLAGEFRWHGKKLFVVVNHFSSKSDDQPLMGHNQPPNRLSEVPNQQGKGGRHAQAAVVNGFVNEILDVDPQANVIVLGDINDFEFSQTVDILEGDGELFSAIKTLPENERYSYVFEGNSQVLDQILLSRNIYEHFPYVYDVVHVNSEFSSQASDHEPSVTRIRMTGRPSPKP